MPVARHARRARVLTVLPLLAAFAAAACGGEEAVPEGEGDAISGAVVTASQAPSVADAAPPGTVLDCDAVVAARGRLARRMQLVANLAGEAQLQMLRDRIHVDSMRRELDVVARVPDAPGAALRPASEAVPALRAIVDSLELVLQSERPFSDGTGRGQRFADAVQREFARSQAGLAHAVAEACGRGSQ